MMTTPDDIDAIRKTQMRPAAVRVKSPWPHGLLNLDHLFLTADTDPGSISPVLAKKDTDNVASGDTRTYHIIDGLIIR